MSSISSKDDDPLVSLPDRITLIDCLKLDAKRKYASGTFQLTAATESLRKRNGISHDRLRRVIDYVTDVLLELPFDSEDDE